MCSSHKGYTCTSTCLFSRYFAPECVQHLPRGRLCAVPQKHALTDARHKEVELRRCRQALLAAEGLMQAQQQHACMQQLGQSNGASVAEDSMLGAASDGNIAKQLSPRRAAAAALTCTQQSCLIGALKDHNAALKQAISQMQRQYAELVEPSTAAQQVGTLQQQLQLALEHLQQQQQLVHLLEHRAEEAQLVAQAASAQVELAARALQEVRAAAASAVQSGTDGKSPMMCCFMCRGPFGYPSMCPQHCACRPTCCSL